MIDYLIVGCGFAGATIARKLADAGKHVCIIEKRNHIAGNMYDELHNGILVQRYGPHIFHTNDKQVMEFLMDFGEWTEYHLKCMVYMNGKFTPSPFNMQTIDDYYESKKAIILKKEIRKVYKESTKTTIVEMLKNPSKIIREYAEFLYKNDYSLYTAKQWGISPEQIDVNVLKRVPVLLNEEDGYFQDKYQFMPCRGFTDVFKKMLDHKNIEVHLNIDFKEKCKIYGKDIFYLDKKIMIPVIYTGTLDRLFGYCYGMLPYRTLRFEYEELDQDSYQEAPVVAYPQALGFTRITEFKKLPIQNVNGRTIIAKEYPVEFKGLENGSLEPYYPINSSDNMYLFEQYEKLSKNIKNLYLCGRLAQYQYYNMDQVIANALRLAVNILKGE